MDGARAMDDNNRAVGANPPDSSMLANLMTVGAAYAVRRGVTLDAVANAAGLEPHELVAPPERVPDDAVSRILELLERRFPDEPVALEMVAAAPLHFLGPFQHMAELVPNLRAGIEMFVDFRTVLSTNSVMELIEEPPGPMLRLEHPNDELYGPQNAEMGVAMGVRAIAEAFGLPMALRGVWFSHPPSAPLGRYDDALSVPVRFEAPWNALLFHAHRLDDPIDPDAGARLRILRAHLELVRQQLEQQGDPAELREIRDAAARNAAHGEFSGAALAAQLGMSERTLQRRVGELDRSIRSIIDEVREVAAREMLANDELNTYVIALTLGYSTDSAFRRAFRRWTGQSPAGYRRSLTAATR
ncbi:MAG: AraC family transcriptional regulator ligand-binding domain-containing protein [Actinomycetota bacterium]